MSCNSHIFGIEFILLSFPVLNTSTPCLVQIWIDLNLIACRLHIESCIYNVIGGWFWLKKWLDKKISVSEAMGGSFSASEL